MGSRPAPVKRRFPACIGRVDLAGWPGTERIEELSIETGRVRFRGTKIWKSNLFPETLMDATMVSLISACTALVASVAGPLVTLAVARRQFNANVLSANRQKWIETLREMLAELVSLIVIAAVIKSEWKEKWDKGRGVLARDPALLPKLERIVLVQWKIRLLINPLESDHLQLYQAIEAAQKSLQSEETPDTQTEADIEKITSLGQAILKREWLRVKQGT